MSLPISYYRVVLTYNCKAQSKREVVNRVNLSSLVWRIISVRPLPAQQSSQPAAICVSQLFLDHCCIVRSSRLFLPAAKTYVPFTRTFANPHVASDLQQQYVLGAATSCTQSCNGSYLAANSAKHALREIRLAAFAAGQLVYTTEDKPVALSTTSDCRATAPRVRSVLREMTLYVCPFVCSSHLKRWTAICRAQYCDVTTLCSWSGKLYNLSSVLFQYNVLLNCTF